MGRRSYWSCDQRSHCVAGALGIVKCRGILIAARQKVRFSLARFRRVRSRGPSVWGATVENRDRTGVTRCLDASALVKRRGSGEREHGQGLRSTGGRARHQAFDTRDLIRQVEEEISPVRRSTPEGADGDAEPVIRAGSEAKKKKRLPSHVLKIRRQVLLGVSEDFDDGLTIRKRQRRPVPRVLFLSGQHLPHAPVDRGLRKGRQRVERR